MLEQPPAAVALGIGDVLHNMSSALDSLAFAIARRTHGQRLDEDERLQKATEFPVRYSRDEISTWAAERGRIALYSAGDLDALWCGQTYYWTATAWTEHRIGHEPGSMEAARQRDADPLTRLRHLHNIDKHRRLHVALLGPDLPHWFTSDGTTQRRVAMTGLWQDGQIVAEVYDPPSDAGDSEMTWDLRLKLAEQAEPVLLVSQLEHLQGAVASALGSTIQRREELGQRGPLDAGEGPSE